MKNFLDENFLLSNPTAQRLYHDYAKGQAIYDYHCHLSPREIAEDRQFANLGQMWLEGDHYKWRALRSAGVSEKYITGDASDKDKYLAWAATVPKCIGNPIYHWTHLELRRPFGIENTLFGPDTAEQIWQQTREQLQTPEFSARGIMRRMNVAMVGTTDDPIHSLEHHRAIAADPSFAIEVSPTWRPDRAFKIERQEFGNYVERLQAAANTHIDSYSSFLSALAVRLDHFQAHGCRSADHGIEDMRYAEPPSSAVLSDILAKGRAGAALSDTEISQFSSAVQVWLARQYCQRGWVMQMHIGAQRNNNTRMFNLLGADAGFDSIGDAPFAQPLAALLNAMDRDDALPKTILYTINPSANEMLATMCGNFQGGGIAGKIQFGSGWWFNDQKDGMQRQLEQLAQLGLLSQFVGMLTDSRSFLSYTRHEYFRRILCDKIGVWVENGEAPNDIDLLGAMVSDICYHNAKRYFQRPDEAAGSRGEA